MRQRLKKFMLSCTLGILGYVTVWDLIMQSNSLLLFGEPEYPFKE